MNLPNTLTNFIEKSDLVKSRDEIVSIMKDTRCLACPFIANTDFYKCTISSDFIQNLNLYTIFKRKDFGNVPYKLSDLSRDFRNNSINKEVLGEEFIKNVNNIIKNLKQTLEDGPIPVIVECDRGTNHLILEGNKRMIAMHLCQEAITDPIEIYLGKSSMSWQTMLSFYEMNVS